MTSLQDLLDTARRDGWAIAALTPDQIEQHARLLRWTPTHGPPRRVVDDDVAIRYARNRRGHVR